MPSIHPTLLFVTLAACSYAPPVDELAVDAAPGQLPGDPPPPPSPPDASADAPPQVTCTTSDSSLALCLELEDSTTTTAIDGSGKGHDAAITGVTATTRDVPAASRALGLTTASTFLIGDSPDFDLQTLTISAWVRRSATPAAGQRYGVVDVGRKQAALAIDSAGKAVCMVSTSFNTWVGFGGATAVDEWALIACTYDAPQLCTYVFRNGNPTPTVTCGNTDGEPIDTSVASGGAIGALFDTANQPASRLAGAVDAVRLYGRALTQNQLCTANGLTGC